MLWALGPVWQSSCCKEKIPINSSDVAKQFSVIDSEVAKFIERQKMFFVASAPGGNEGHINCSPKGLDSFRILDNQHVAYLDFVGSGAETIAHLRDNGRIVIMFCAFEGPPQIVRLYGRGAVVVPVQTEFTELLATFGRTAPLGVRAIIRIDVTRVSTSCGFGVPLYRYEGDRTQLPAWVNHKGESGLRKYQLENNDKSLDGLPSLSPKDVI
jgi:Pyridoxamine 5'-phosphate oxidase